MHSRLVDLYIGWGFGAVSVGAAVLVGLLLAVAVRIGEDVPGELVRLAYDAVELTAAALRWIARRPRR